MKPWNGNTGFSLHSGRKLAVNTWAKIRAKPENLITKSVSWYELDYREITETNFTREICFTVDRKGVAHGLVLWFEAELFEGIGFSNAPGAEELIYGQAFFPFEDAVPIAGGDCVDVRLEARLIGDNYVWRWDTNVGSHISFKQSTLLGVPFSTSELRKRAK